MRSNYFEDTGELIEVFRIEHQSTHLGPFQTNDPYTQDLAKKAGKIRYLKSPGDDGLWPAYIPYGFSFGCPSLVALKKWIFLGGTFDSNEEIIRQLDARGFVLAEYLTPDLECQYGWSGLQLTFDAETARDEGLVEYSNIKKLIMESPLVFCIN